MQSSQRQGLFTSATKAATKTSIMFWPWQWLATACNICHLHFHHSPQQKHLAAPKTHTCNSIHNHTAISFWPSPGILRLNLSNKGFSSSASYHFSNAFGPIRLTIEEVSRNF